MLLSAESVDVSVTFNHHIKIELSLVYQFSHAQAVHESKMICEPLVSEVFG